MTAAMRDWQGAIRESSSSSKYVVENIVVPLDGSDEAKLALPVAYAIAQLHGSTLHVIHVGQQPGTPRHTVQELGLSGKDLRGAVIGHATGAPAEAILRIAGELPNSLIVTCTDAIAPDMTSLGAMSEALLDAAPPQLLLMTPAASSEAWTPRRVLLAHDGSPSADSAILPAAELAQLSGAEVVALHVAAPRAEQPDEPGCLPAPRYVDQPQHEWPSWAGEFVNRMLALGGSKAAINFKLLVTGGQPGSEIAQFAINNEADLVILPWHGKWQAQRGGAVEAVVRRSGCPVLLICTITA
jgi:nucleotide-binding universal stress UspA family protein